jgi:hypothetical protein
VAWSSGKQTGGEDDDKANDQGIGKNNVRIVSSEPK